MTFCWLVSLVPKSDLGPKSHGPVIEFWNA